MTYSDFREVKKRDEALNLRREIALFLTWEIVMGVLSIGAVLLWGR